MANSLMQLVSDGNLSVVPLTIKFFEHSHIDVYIDNVALPTAGYSYTWSGATTITITPTVALGVEVSIRRRTPADYVLHDFQAGAVFSEVSIDENFRQDLFLLQEAKEQSLVTDLFTDIDMHGNKARNLGNAVLGGDATPLSQVQQIISASGGNPFVYAQLFEALRRSYAGFGYNLVGGSFEAGFTLVNAGDVALHEASGKAYSGPAGTYPAGTNPASDPDFVDVSEETSRRTLHLNDAKWGLTTDVTKDNTVQLALILQNLPDDVIVDFGGMALRVYADVAGLGASSSNPTTDNALPLAQCVLVNGAKRVKFVNGTIYAADAGVSATKMYFPSTVSFTNCQDLEFDNFWAEGKGESWGDADASLSQTKLRRLEFSVTNGGHAAFFGRCKGIKGNVNGRLCGSTGVLYFSSSTGIKLDNPFANAASLGYNPICFDSWVGSTSDVGVSDFLALVVNPVLRKETLFRREDGTTPVGSSAYAGKGGILTEGVGVQCYSLGGDISDMYAAGSNQRLGYAFGAGSGSINKNVGARVRACQEVIFANWSTADPSTCIALDVDAVVGLAGVLIDKQPFGSAYMKLTGNVTVDGSRIWAASADIDLRETSLICSLKPSSTATVDVDCVCPRDASLANIVSNKSVATYGAVRFLGGIYHFGGHLIDSVGWGGGSDDQETGIFAVGACRFIDQSNITLTAAIRYQNRDAANVFTYVNHDLSRAVITGNSFRPLDGYTFFGTNLVRAIKLPTPGGKLYMTGATRTHDRSVALSCALTCVSVDGLSGANSLITFRVGNNSALTANARIINGANLHRVIGPNTVFTDRPDDATTTYRNGVTRQYTLEGDVRLQYVAGTTYVVVGA